MHALYFTDTQQANYHVVAAVTYRANGAVSRSCLPQYQDLMSQYYMNLNNILTQRCSAVNVNMNVSFVRSVPYLIEENVLKVTIVEEVLTGLTEEPLTKSVSVSDGLHSRHRPSNSSASAVRSLRFHSESDLRSVSTLH